MDRNIKGELSLMKNLGIKPNFAALGREYGMDPRTVKKYYEGYKGKSKTRNKPSKLDKYKDVIRDKLTIKRITVRGVYEFMVDTYGVNVNIKMYKKWKIKMYIFSVILPLRMTQRALAYL